MRFTVLMLLIICTEGVLAQKTSYDSIRNQDCTLNEKIERIDALLVKPFPDSTVLADCFHEFAKYLYANGHYQKSIHYAEKSVSYRLTLDDIEKLKKSLYNLGIFYRVADRNIDATNTFRQLISIGTEDRYHGKAHVELGMITTTNGDFYNALLHHQQAAMIFKRTNHARDLYKNYMELSRLYAVIDRNEYAEEILTVLSKIDSLGIDIDSRDRMIIEMRKGGVFDELKVYEKAIKSYQLAFVYGELVADSVAICTILNNLAVSKRKNGELNEARNILHNAYAHSDDPALRAMVFNNLGDLFLELNNTDSARIYYQQSINLYSKGYESINFQTPILSEIINSPYKVELLESIISMADYWRVVFDLKKEARFLRLNLSYLELADQLLENLRFHSRESHSKRFWSAKASSIYSKALSACLISNDIEKAYYFMERNKAILLLENLSEKQAQVNASMSHALIERQFKLKKRISNLQQKAYDQRKLGESVDNMGINQAIFDYNLFLDSLKTEFPFYRQLLSKTPILSLSKHKSHLIDKRTLTLQYLMNKTACYGLMISSDTTILFRTKSDTLSVWLKKFHQHIIKPFKFQSDIDNFRSLSHDVYRLLLDKVGTHTLNDKRLIISPDYLLNNLNFESLLVDSSTEPMKDGFLINFSEISYVYSFSHLIANNQLLRHNNGEFSVFTPGSFLNDGLTNLPASLAEGKKIASILDGNHFSGSASTKNQFLNSLESANLIHIATHAVYTKESMPKVALYDMAISDQELYSYRCNADLVVLGACGTSLGEYASGEGVMSLSRAFLYAGANSVISTLSNINDGSTGDIMTDFYQNISNGDSKSSSLRLAKLQYLQQAKGSEMSPYYWAPYVLIGNHNNNIFRKNKFISPLALLLILAMISFYLLKIRKQ